MSLPCRVVVLTATVWIVAGQPAGAAGQTTTPAAGMAPHFQDVTAVHEAVIRGDLEGARIAAAALAKRDVTGSPATAANRDALKSLAGRVAASPDLAAAAAATGLMLGACGDCHRASGAMPVPSVPDRPALGQTVGHMLDHQRAADQLMQGLVVPSSTLWNQGAQTLRTAPLSTGKLPKDPKLTSDIAAGEQRIHQLADQAAGTSEPQARATIYGQMLGACANCHALHKNVWGPSKK
jgi:cytochrome c553